MLTIVVWIWFFVIVFRKLISIEMNIFLSVVLGLLVAGCGDKREDVKAAAHELTSGQTKDV